MVWSNGEYDCIIFIPTCFIILFMSPIKRCLHLSKFTIDKYVLGKESSTIIIIIMDHVKFCNTYIIYIIFILGNI